MRCYDRVIDSIGVKDGGGEGGGGEGGGGEGGEGGEGGGRGGRGGRGGMEKGSLWNLEMVDGMKN